MCIPKTKSVYPVLVWIHSISRSGGEEGGREAERDREEEEEERGEQRAAAAQGRDPIISGPRGPPLLLYTPLPYLPDTRHTCTHKK